MKKQTENTTATAEKKQSRTEQTEAKRTAVITVIEKLGYIVKASANDTEKKKRFTVYSDTKSLCTITYSAKEANTVKIKAGIEYTGATYYAGWAKPYSSDVDYTTELVTVLAELAEKKQKKQTEQKAETAEKKQTEKKQKQTTKKQTATAEQKKQTTKRKATTADLQKKATAKK